MFVNRERELEALESRYTSGRAELVVVTGRRRVGKTALLSAFAGSKQALRFTAYLDSEESQLRRLSALLRDANEQRPFLVDVLWRVDQHGVQSRIDDLCDLGGDVDLRSLAGGLFRIRDGLDLTRVLKAGIDSGLNGGSDG